MSLMLLEKLAPCLVEHTYMERSYASLVGENKIKKKKDAANRQNCIQQRRALFHAAPQ